MTQRVLTGSLSPLRNRAHAFLAFFWLFGLSAGVLLSMHIQDVLSALMRGMLYAPVSIVGLSMNCLLPFLLSAFAVYYHTPIWIFPIAAGKALLFAVTFVGLWDIAGSAGWLLQVLLLFADFLAMPMLYLYWLRSLSADPCIFWELLPWPLAILWVQVCVNDRFVVPLFAEFGNR